MSLAVLKSRALSGMEAPQVTVEVHLANGLPSFTTLGLNKPQKPKGLMRPRVAILGLIKPDMKSVQWVVLEWKK